MKHQNKMIISSLLLLSLLGSCGGKDNNNNKTNNDSVTQWWERTAEEESAPIDGSNIQGHYQAKFTTVNPHVNGTIPGSANFFRQDQRIFAYVRLFAGGVRAWHRQHVYTGGRCPTLDDDLNKDGFIDINEAEKVLGKILIPLDSDITTQNSGSRFFPLGDLSGYYHYERITNFERFLDDLQAPDQNLEDDVVKIPDGRGLVIAGKTFMVQGVAETVDLPESVGTKEKKRAFQTLPVACGVFEKIITSPGQTYVENEIPGPMAEVIEGQDRPVEEEVPESEGEDDQRPGTNTNESDHGNGPISDGEPN